MWVPTHLGTLERCMTLPAKKRKCSYQVNIIDLVALIWVGPLLDFEIDLACVDAITTCQQNPHKFPAKCNGRTGDDGTIDKCSLSEMPHYTRSISQSHARHSPPATPPPPDRIPDWSIPPLAISRLWDVCGEKRSMPSCCIICCCCPPPWPTGTCTMPCRWG